MRCSWVTLLVMSSFILTSHYKINQYLYKSIIKIRFYGFGRIFISFYFIMICYIFLCDIFLTALFYDCVWKTKFYNLIIDGCSQHAWSLLRRHCGCFPGECMANHAVNNSVTFQGTRNSTITFLSAPNASIVIEGQIGVSFYLPPTVQVNHIHNIFPPPVWKPVHEGETVNK